MRKLLAGAAIALVPLAGVALTAAAAPAQAHAEAMLACGNATYVNENTSCDFAHNVTDAWFASPSNQVGAWSPALQRVIIMDCAHVVSWQGSGEVCRGGNYAGVVFFP